VHVPAVRSTHPINDYLQQRQSIVAVGHSHHTITSGAMCRCQALENPQLLHAARSQREATVDGMDE